MERMWKPILLAVICSFEGVPHLDIRLNPTVKLRSPIAGVLAWAPPRRTTHPTRRSSWFFPQPPYSSTTTTSYTGGISSILFLSNYATKRRLITRLLQEDGDEIDDEDRGAAIDPSESSSRFQDQKEAPKAARNVIPPPSTTPAVGSAYLATCIPGLADVLARELQQLGSCQQVTTLGNAAVSFVADPPTALTALLWARTPHKIMELLLTSHPQLVDDDSSSYSSGVHTITNRDDLYQFIRQGIDVKDLLGNGQGGLLTLSVTAILNNPRHLPADLSHSHFSSLTVKNALCDMVRDQRGDRPTIDLEDPDVPLVLIMRGVANSMRGAVSTMPPGDGEAQVSLYRQLHPPGSLHKRGYRQGAAIHKAAMKESLAAGLLLRAEWPERCQRARCHSSNAVEEGDAETAILVDPMAGSGSLLLEAALIAADLAPGLMRIKCGLVGHNLPPMLRWKNQYDGLSANNLKQVWRGLLLEAKDRAKKGLADLRAGSSHIYIMGNDLHEGALDILENALDVSGLRDVIHVACTDCKYWEPSLPRQTEPLSGASWLVTTNPPWGVRLTEDMSESWEALRSFLREKCPDGSEAWILSGNPAATKHLGLRKSMSVPIKTGEQDLRWIQYMIRPRGEAGFSMNNAEDGKEIAFKRVDRPSPIVKDPARQRMDRVVRPERQRTRKPPTSRSSAQKPENEWLI